VLAAVAGDFDAVPGDEPAPIEKLKKGEVAVSITEAERIIAAAHGVAPKAVDVDTGADGGAPFRFIVKKPTIRPALEQPEERIAALAEDHLAVCMDAVDLVEGWCKAVRAEVERRMLAGTPVPGYKLVEGRAGARAWADPAEAEKLLKSFRLKQDEMYDFTLISPTTAEKVLAQASPKRWAKAQALIRRSDGKPSVAPASDKRPALVITPVADDFDELPPDAGTELEQCQFCGAAVVDPCEAPPPDVCHKALDAARPAPTALQPDARWPFPGDVSPGSPAAEHNASLDVVDDLV
jgi:hypothetical protein